MLVFLSLIFLIAISCFVFFIMSILMPALEAQIIHDTNPLFSLMELGYAEQCVEDNVKVTPKRAVVLEYGSKGSEARMKYNGIKNCALFEHIYGTLSYSQNACIGFGDCAAVCPQEAIILEKGMARVTSACCGCEICVDVCPKNIIRLFPQSQKSVVYENNVIPEQIIEFPEKKHFKFWQSCYKILG